MIYECLVIDNSNFFKNGTIRVRIKKEVSSRVMIRDISVNPEESISSFGNQRYEKYGNEKEFKYDDEDVRVMSPIGGAYDYGLFILPQPNSWGMIAEVSSYWEDSLEPRFVWIGAISMFNMATKSIDIPSDDIYKKNGCNEGTVNLKKPYSGLTFKQKETHISNSSKDITDESKKTLNWEERPTQNMVVMNEDEIVIYHNNLNDNGERETFSQLSLNKEGVQIKLSDDDENNNSKLTLSNDGTFTLMNEDFKRKTSNILSSLDNSLSLSHNDGKSNINLSMETNSSSGDPKCSLNLSKEGNKIPTEIILSGENGITINSNSNISINPGPNGDITLGTGEGYILTSAAPGTFNIDNHTITATRNAKA